MSDINLQLVREFFELNGFGVQTQWRPGSDHSQQLFVENPRVTEAGTEAVLLRTADLTAIRRAVVEVRPWHTDRIYASVVENNPILTQFALPESLGHARDFFGSDTIVTILVVSELPTAIERRIEALDAFRARGVTSVLEFGAVLKDIVDKTPESASLPPSSTLQLVQLLKRYNLTRRQQLELTYPLEAPPSVNAPVIETVEVEAEQEERE